MKEYHKIKNIFKRDEKTKKLIENRFADPTIEFLKDLPWEFTEKIDGTNIRVGWDGHRVNFYGRTDNAQIPVRLMNRLLELFGGDANEQLFEQKFGNKPVMLIGEGYGAGIQKGGAYSREQEFVLFDVLIDDMYLMRDSVFDIATYFGVPAVPVVVVGTIQEGVDYVKSSPMSLIGTAMSEGLVGRPKFELLDRRGERVIVKIRVCDF